MKHTLKQIVAGNTAELTYVCAGKVYYEISVMDLIDDCGLDDVTIYQLEIDSMDDEWKITYLMPTFDAIILMRWIRKGIESNDGTFLQIK